MDDASPSRIELVAHALTRMSPDLVGLLAQGLEVLQAGEHPGSVYLLAHAGREISNTVVSQLSDSPVALTPEEEAELKRKKQSFRRDIASALNLSIDHPLVAEWFELHDVFASNASIPGVDIVTLARLMGHGDNIQTIMIYAKHVGDYAARGCRVMHNALGL